MRAMRSPDKAPWYAPSGDPGHDYRSFFDNAVEGIFRTSPEGRYLVVNRALAEMYGYVSPEALIDNVTNIASQLYVDPQRRAIFRMLLSQQDSIIGFEAEVRRRDGSTLWIREKARVARGPDGRVACYEGFVEDITAERRARATTALCERAIASAADAMAIFARDGSLAWSNPSFGELTGTDCSTLESLMTRLASGEPGAWKTTRTGMLRCGIPFVDRIVVHKPGAEPRACRMTAHAVSGIGGADEVIAISLAEG
jgi:PAS domain S-box-containing protein